MKEQEGRPDSVLTYYKKLLVLRKCPEYKETFTYGRFVPDYEDQDGIFAYHRISGKDNGKAGADGKTDTADAAQDILIAANYGTGPCTLKLAGQNGKVLPVQHGRRGDRNMGNQRERDDHPRKLRGCGDPAVNYGLLFRCTSYTIEENAGGGTKGAAACAAALFCGAPGSRNGE